MELAAVEVQAKNFTAWLEDVVQEKTVDGKAPNIYLKVDIEGAEYDLLEQFQKSALFCDVPLYLIEWHEGKFKEDADKYNEMVQKHAQFNEAVDKCRESGKEMR